MSTCFTQHALERFMQRCGKNATKALDRLSILTERPIRIGKHRYYNRGWILVIKRGELKTVYQPQHKREFDAIHKAFTKAEQS